MLPNIISVSFLIEFDHTFLQLESSIDILQQTSSIIFNFTNFRLIFTINGQPRIVLRRMLHYSFINISLIYVIMVNVSLTNTILPSFFIRNSKTGQP